MSTDYIKNVNVIPAHGCVVCKKKTKKKLEENRLEFIVIAKWQCIDAFWNTSTYCRTNADFEYVENRIITYSDSRGPGTGTNWGY